MGRCAGSALDIEGSTNASNLGGSSWYVLASSPAERRPRRSTSSRRSGAATSTSTRRSSSARAPSARGSQAREGEAYQSSDEFFGGQPVWQNFSTWLAQVPDVDYGIFTAEVDSAISAQLPTIAQGGDLDAAIEAINAQAMQATQ